MILGDVSKLQRAEHDRQIIYEFTYLSLPNIWAMTSDDAGLGTITPTYLSYLLYYDMDLARLRGQLKNRYHPLVFSSCH
jgi:hypothetical protein